MTTRKGILLAGGSGTRLFPGHARDFETAASDLRQAHGLLPADRADAGRDPRDRHHHHAARP